ncbi:Uncharacterised protein [Enterobacter ludwigii]|nr:Uncharacterised protein [Enterobacter ludwigii]
MVLIIIQVGTRQEMKSMYPQIAAAADIIKIINIKFVIVKNGHGVAHK